MLKTKDIHQEVIFFHTTPHVLYEMLMNSEKHAAFTKEPAKISRKVGGKIYAYGEWIEGKNLELIPDTKIVQQWRGADWPEGHFSKVTFMFTQKDENTVLTFSQIGVPVEQYHDIDDGWKSEYWEKMKKTLKK